MKMTKKTGFTLIEAMVAIAILGLVALGITKLMTSSTNLMVKSREQTFASKTTQAAFNLLDNSEYIYLLDCDSDNASYGLIGTFDTNPSYPYLGVLDQIKEITTAAGFDQFTIETDFMIRDLSDLDGDGEITDLRSFLDGDSDNIDDYEPGMMYYDANSDGDFYDIYAGGSGNYITEEPNTHIKEVLFKLYKQGKQVFSERQLVSREKLSGEAGYASEAELNLIVSSPTHRSSLYDLTAANRLDAFNLSISKSYPSTIQAFRADISYPLEIEGETEPIADLDFRIETATNPVLDSTSADIYGDFNLNATYITGELDEGVEYIWGKATKGSSYSPWSKREVIYDLVPPVISGETSIGTVKTKQPYVSAVFTDSTILTNARASGICTDVITILKDGSEVNCEYEYDTGLAEWLESSTFLPTVLSTGIAYAIQFEGGDNAYYKVMSSWTMTCDIDDPDNSAPVVDNTSPSGTIGVNPPTISCRTYDNHSGINYSSIILKLDGATCIDSSNLGNNCIPLESPVGCTVSYTPANSLATGSHSVEFIVQHWTENPYAQKTTTSTWSFNVP